MALGPEEVRELARLLDQDQDGARGTLLFLWADQAGQITYSNLYAASEPITDQTEKEAQQMLEISFRWGHSRNTWIIGDRHKKTWTIGTTWKRPYKFTEHFKRAWYHGVCQHEEDEHGNQPRSTDWIAFDCDRHSGKVPAHVHMQRLRELLAQEGFAAMLAVNPKNGSAHVWVYVGPGLPYRNARLLIASWRRRLPWLAKTEIWPDNLPQVIVPLRGDKLLCCEEKVPIIKRRGFRHNRLTGKRQGYTYTAYSCAHVWHWTRAPQMAPWEVWEDLLGEACARTPDAVPQTQDAKSAPEPTRRQRRKDKRRDRKDKVSEGLGSVGPMKGRWLRLLYETYVEGVRPPDDTVDIIETSVIRYCRVGAYGAAIAKHCQDTSSNGRRTA
jgi:hypothetical protein